MAYRIADFITRHAREFRITVPTALTIARLVCIPGILVCLFYARMQIALVLFATAALTDVLDGFLARMLNQRTFLGACLDPIADKLLVGSLFFALWWIGNPYIPGWFVLLVLTKELVQVVGALLIFLHKNNLFVCPVLLGKASMFMQTCFIFVVLLGYFQPLPTRLFFGMRMVSAVLLGASLVQYVGMGIRQYR